MKIPTTEEKPRKLLHQEWLDEGRELYGPDRRGWKFRCPVCKRVTKVSEWVDSGSVGQIAFSCIGRSVDGIGCDYAGGGLFRLNPVTIVYPDGTETQTFEFADRKARREGSDES